MVYLLGLLCSALSGFLVGKLYQSVKQENEITHLKKSLRYWQLHSRFGLSPQTFDPDLYDR